ncbi:hypothetical protein Pmani_017576 [Petrolisthes manimaculis]|uniref:N-acetyllactosaminide beta-1,3-N-acetylglucosaminyltransferase n=1 Tax=Petrolisthes manimaculis TaxID=1843537 RepID=A0AAE1U7M2_9EUCA|nr:hypothetical protein Pmani_017576 [Petrolisthes manimaculis]
MVWTRTWRRWQQWVCVGAALVIGAWLLLAAPCALLACPPQQEPNGEFSNDQLHQDRYAARMVCIYLSLVPTTQRPQIQGSPQLGMNGPYRVLYSWIPSSRMFTVNESVTYSTHATPEMIHHVGELASRWSGPISVAVFAPSSDFCLAAARIAQLRACGPPAVREQVTWHLFWPKDAPPGADWRMVVEEVSDCDEDTTAAVRGYRVTEGIPYPVNVARNIARTASPTWFVLPSDVELYPSQGLAEQFLSLVKQDTWRLTTAWPRIFVVPVFEVATSVPVTKEELIHQYMRHDAVYFHRHVCAHCQRFPAITEWVHRLGTPGSLQVFSVVKREFPYHRWEPIYICTKEEPMYDERLSWEGLQDKMTQMHELCLRNYSLVILDRAFLVHSPGIKRRTKNKGKVAAWREPFVAKNSKVYDDIIMEEMLKKFGPSEKCKPH